MTKASDIMTTKIITFAPDMDITKATKTLLEKQINGAPVVDKNDNLLGILCQSDLITQQKKLPLPTIFTFLDGLIPLTSIKQIEKQIRKMAAITVSEAMTSKPVNVQPDTDIETIAALMVDNKFHTLPVVEGSRLVGIIGKKDVLMTLLPVNKNT